MQKRNQIFGLDKIGVYWTIRITCLIALIAIVWTIAIPNIQKTLSAISFLIPQSLESSASPEFRLIILFVSLYLTCYFISIGIKLYEKVWNITKEFLHTSNTKEKL